MTCFCKGVGVFKGMTEINVREKMKASKKLIKDHEGKAEKAFDLASDLSLPDEMALDIYEKGLREGFQMSLEWTIDILEEISGYLSTKTWKDIKCDEEGAAEEDVEPVEPENV